MMYDNNAERKEIVLHRRRTECMNELVNNDSWW